MHPRLSFRLGRAGVFFFTEVLLWFGLELSRRISPKGGGIRDTRVKAHPVIWLTRRPQNPRHSNILSTPVVFVFVVDRPYLRQRSLSALSFKRAVARSVFRPMRAFFFHESPRDGAKS